MWQPPLLLIWEGVMLELTAGLLFVVGVVTGWQRLATWTQTTYRLSRKKAAWISTLVWGLGFLAGFGILVAIGIGGWTSGKFLLRKFRRSTSTVGKVSKPATDSGCLDVIRFKYKGRDDARPREREVRASGVDRSYIEGLCMTRCDIRTFRLDRVKGEVVSLQTGEIFPSAEAWRDERTGDPRNRGVSPVPDDYWKKRRP